MSSIYEAILEAERTGQPAALATVIRARGSVPRHETSKMLVFADGRIAGTVGGGELENRTIEEAKKVAHEGQARIISHSLVDPSRGDAGVCGGEVEVFIEPIMPPATLLIVGAGHVGRALAHLARWMGYRVVVTDDRADLCTHDFIPDADEFVVGPMTEALNKLRMDHRTYVACVTRGYLFDVDALPILLNTPAPYIGVIGSRRRWTMALKDLHAKGTSDESLARVHAPIGLEIQAETPEEIAVSIMAEIVMLRRGGTGQPMSQSIKVKEEKP
jgi:xanthine dehydrogenase accessory factor